jgi:single-stranded-DNA-specific exonuclease
MRQWSKGTKRSTSVSKTPTRPKKQPNPQSGTRAASTKRLPPPTPSEQAFETALAAVVGNAVEIKPADASRAAIDKLFARSADYLSDPFSTIGDAAQFHTKLAGVSFEGRQDVIAGLRAGVEVRMARQADNPYDGNAIAVHYGQLQLGFISKGIAAHIAPLIDAGVSYRVRVASLTGGTSAKHRGVNVFVERVGAATAPPRAAAALPFAEPGDPDLSVRVTAALLGAAAPHSAQKAVLERLDAGRNTIAVFGTGRGKSFCFQYTAAMRALTGSGKTLVIYPLRALANDQFEALRRTLDALGLRFFRANGSIDHEEREELFAALRDGAWDVVLATPEFLEFHRDAFGANSLPSLVVLDEAHHLHESRHRPAYARLPETIRALGDPQVLALTATAGDECFARIREELRIDAWVIDPTVRDNLRVVDARNTKDKLTYLKDVFAGAGGEKGIVYCYSRTEVTKVARALRKPLNDEVMFYHGKMPNADRLEVERLFREGALRVVVATSAFGEGIDLPDVRNVVIYHLNFDAGEFNQQAGRAGRDGEQAHIHLLYGQQDKGLNEFLIDLESPRLERLREIYRGLRALARDGIVHGSYSDLAATLSIDGVRDNTIAAAVRIFEDSGLAETGEDDESRFVRFLRVRDRVDMASNERFAEGEAIRDAFAKFYELASNASAETLERVINRPIYPSRIALLQ